MAEELKSDSVTTRFGVDPDVLRLGLVSFLTDVSSEMIFSVFAIFFKTQQSARCPCDGREEDRENGKYHLGTDIGEEAHETEPEHVGIDAKPRRHRIRL